MGARAVDAELRDRIAKLERMVQTFHNDPAEPGLESTNSSTSDPQTYEPPAVDEVVLSEGSSPADRPLAVSSKYVASTFWSSLISEVQAIKEAFEEEGPESDMDALSLEPTPPQAASSSDSAAGGTAAYELILCPPGALYIMPGVSREPEPSVAMELTSLYFTYVERMERLFHLPTLQSFLYENQPYLGREPDAPCNKFLRMSILFAGSTALAEEESQTKFNRSRESVMQEYRSMVDIAMYQADPLNSVEMATLQALVLYVVSHLMRLLLAKVLTNLRDRYE